MAAAKIKKYKSRVVSFYIPEPLQPRVDALLSERLRTRGAVMEHLLWVAFDKLDEKKNGIRV